MSDTILDPVTHPKCPRKVLRHKYERLSKSNQIWWNNKFKELEDNIRLPSYKKYSELRKLYTRVELKALQAAGFTFYIDDAEKIKRKRRYAYAKRRSTFQSTIFVPPRRSSLASRTQFFGKRLMDFFKSTPENAKVWATKAKREVEEAKNLIERAAIVEEELAEDFDNWFSSIKTYTTSEINKQTILNIFEINNSLPINKAVEVNLQQMNSVPDHVARYIGKSDLAHSVVIKREINKDMNASKQTPINHAFGTMLPPNLRKVKYIPDDKMKISSDHQELESFAAVFKDIMELETSKRFIIWLRNNPHIQPPSFLQKTYMATKKRTIKKSFFIREIYEAKSFPGDRSSIGKESSSESSGNTLSLSGDGGDDSLSQINFIV